MSNERNVKVFVGLCVCLCVCVCLSQAWSRQHSQCSLLVCLNCETQRNSQDQMKSILTKIIRRKVGARQTEYSSLPIMLPRGDLRWDCLWRLVYTSELDASIQEHAPVVYAP